MPNPINAVISEMLHHYAVYLIKSSIAAEYLAATEIAPVAYGDDVSPGDWIYLSSEGDFRVLTKFSAPPADMVPLDALTPVSSSDGAMTNNITISDYLMPLCLAAMGVPADKTEDEKCLLIKANDMLGNEDEYILPLATDVCGAVHIKLFETYKYSIGDVSTTQQRGTAETVSFNVMQPPNLGNNVDLTLDVSERAKLTDGDGLEYNGADPTLTNIESILQGSVVCPFYALDDNDMKDLSNVYPRVGFGDDSRPNLFRFIRPALVYTRTAIAGETIPREVIRIPDNFRVDFQESVSSVNVSVSRGNRHRHFFPHVHFLAVGRFENVQNIPMAGYNHVRFSVLVNEFTRWQDVGAVQEKEYDLREIPNSVDMEIVLQDPSMQLLKKDFIHYGQLLENNGLFMIPVSFHGNGGGEALTLQVTAVTIPKDERIYVYSSSEKLWYYASIDTSSVSITSEEIPIPHITTSESGYMDIKLSFEKVLSGLEVLQDVPIENWHNSLRAAVTELPDDFIGEGGGVTATSLLRHPIRIPVNINVGYTYGEVNAGSMDKNVYIYMNMLGDNNQGHQGMAPVPSAVEFIKGDNWRYMEDDPSMLMAGASITLVTRVLGEDFPPGDYNKNYGHMRGLLKTGMAEGEQGVWELSNPNPITSFNGIVADPGDPLFGYNGHILQETYVLSKNTRVITSLNTMSMAGELRSDMRRGSDALYLHNVNAMFEYTCHPPMIISKAYQTRHVVNTDDSVSKKTAVTYTPV